MSRRLKTRADLSLERYLQEIGETSLLTPEEEIELAKKIKKSDHDAMKKLIKANLRFVVSVAKDYQCQGLTLGDLISEGNIGLIKAARRFDETRGFKFISYAVWWIRQSILQALAEQSRVVRLPLNKVGALNKIRKVCESLEQDLEREPSAGEIAEELGMTSSEVYENKKVSGQHRSLDAPIKRGDDKKLLDLIQDCMMPLPDNNMDEDSLRIEIKRALGTLKGREAGVIELYFGLSRERPLTLEEIGVKFNLTRERVRQIKDKAIRRLRHTSRSRQLRKYLD